MVLKEFVYSFGTVFISNIISFRMLEVSSLHGEISNGCGFIFNPHNCSVAVNIPWIVMNVIGLILYLKWLNLMDSNFRPFSCPQPNTENISRLSLATRIDLELSLANISVVTDFLYDILNNVVTFAWLKMERRMDVSNHLVYVLLCSFSVKLIILLLMCNSCTG